MHKSISIKTILLLVDYFNHYKIIITLLDPQNEYKELKFKVHNYLENTSLEEAGNLIKNTELYVGADSMFVHFAYLYKTPFIVVYNEKNLYWAPPGVKESGNFIEKSNDINRSELYSLLDKIFDKTTTS